MSFIDGKPHVVEESHLKAKWGGRPGPFRCMMCGDKFKLGDTFRFVYTNNISGAGGNPRVCVNCDTPDVVEKWKEMCELARNKFWWFCE